MILKLVLRCVCSLGVLSLGACKNTNKEPHVETVTMNAEAEKTGSNTDLNEVKEVTKSTFSDTSLQASFTDYLAVKGALVNTNAEATKAAANKLINSLKNTTDAEAALAAAQTISTTDDINKQRAAFENLSKAIEDLLAGEIAAGKVYKQFCPMAFEGRGAAWLSNSEEIRNPYFGDEMLVCGFVETVLE